MVQINIYAIIMIHFVSSKVVSFYSMYIKYIVRINCF